MDDFLAAFAACGELRTDILNSQLSAFATMLSQCLESGQHLG